MEDADKKLSVSFNFEPYRIIGELVKYWRDDIGCRYIIELSSVGLRSEGGGALDELKSWVFDIVQMRLYTVSDD